MRMKDAKVVAEVAVGIAIVFCLIFTAILPRFRSNPDWKPGPDFSSYIVSEGGALAGMIELYRMNTGHYPSELKDLIKRPDNLDVSDKWRGPYIKDVAKLKDSWNRDLKYRCPGHHRKDAYDLWSVGEDGVDGTSDDITNWSEGS
jgi:type II secretion system protein G